VIFRSASCSLNIGNLQACYQLNTSGPLTKLAAYKHNPFQMVIPSFTHLPHIACDQVVSRRFNDSDQPRGRMEFALGWPIYLTRQVRKGGTVLFIHHKPSNVLGEVDWYFTLFQTPSPLCALYIRQRIGDEFAYWPVCPSLP